MLGGLGKEGGCGEGPGRLGGLGKEGLGRLGWWWLLTTEQAGRSRTPLIDATGG